MKLLLAAVAFVTAEASLFGTATCGDRCSALRRCTDGICQDGICGGKDCPEEKKPDMKGDACGATTCSSWEFCNAGVACTTKSLEGEACYSGSACYSGFKCDNGLCREDTGKYAELAVVASNTLTVDTTDSLDEIVEAYCEAVATVSEVDRNYLACTGADQSTLLMGRRLTSAKTYVLRAMTTDPTVAKKVVASADAVLEVLNEVGTATVSTITELPEDPVPGSVPNAVNPTPAPATAKPTMKPASVATTSAPAPTSATTSAPAPAPAPASGGSGCAACASSGGKWDTTEAGEGTDKGACQAASYAEKGCETPKTNSAFYCVQESANCCYGCTLNRGAWFEAEDRCKPTSTCSADDVAAGTCIKSRTSCPTQP